MLPEASATAQTVTVLGSTGSIGVNTLDVIARHPQAYRVYALTANCNAGLLFSQCLRFAPRYAVLADEAAAGQLQTQLSAADSETEVLHGQSGLEWVAAAKPVDTVMAAIVGAAGLLPTLAAVNAGKKVLLANKEALVMAGSLFMQAAAEANATLLPIDSEHNAMFQCLPTDYVSGQTPAHLRKLVLTGSGGPFRNWSAEQIACATPEQACNHPNWSMGRKISVDSASLMNKGLEFIEACRLFNVAPEQIEVLIHPQSIIHSMVEFVDGSVLAQMGQPDMRTPIAHALAWPRRIESGVSSLDLMTTARLDFEAPDLQRFSCLSLAMDAVKSGAGAPAVLNAANEVAVEAFLQGAAGFAQIPAVIEAVLTAVQGPADSIGQILSLDAEARRFASSILADGHGTARSSVV